MVCIGVRDRHTTCLSMKAYLLTYLPTYLRIKACWPSVSFDNGLFITLLIKQWFTRIILIYSILLGFWVTLKVVSSFAFCKGIYCARLPLHLGHKVRRFSRFCGRSGFVNLFRHPHNLWHTSRYSSICTFEKKQVCQWSKELFVDLYVTLLRCLDAVLAYCTLYTSSRNSALLLFWTYLVGNNYRVIWTKSGNDLWKEKLSLIITGIVYLVTIIYNILIIRIFQHIDLGQ